VKKPASEEEYQACKLRLTVVVEDIDLEMLPDLGKFQYFYGLHGEDTLYYSRNFLFLFRGVRSKWGLLHPHLSIEA